MCRAPISPYGDHSLFSRRIRHNRSCSLITSSECTFGSHARYPLGGASGRPGRDGINLGNPKCDPIARSVHTFRWARGFAAMELTSRAWAASARRCAWIACPRSTSTICTSDCSLRQRMKTRPQSLLNGRRPRYTGCTRFVHSGNKGPLNEGPDDCRSPHTQFIGTASASSSTFAGSAHGRRGVHVLPTSRSRPAPSLRGLASYVACLSCAGDKRQARRSR